MAAATSGTTSEGTAKNGSDSWFVGSGKSWADQMEEEDVMAQKSSSSGKAVSAAIGNSAPELRNLRRSGGCKGSMKWNIRKSTSSLGNVDNILSHETPERGSYVLCDPSILGGENIDSPSSGISSPASCSSIKSDSDDECDDSIDDSRLNPPEALDCALLVLGTRDMSPTDVTGLFHSIVCVVCVNQVPGHPDLYNLLIKDKKIAYKLASGEYNINNPKTKERITFRTLEPINPRQASDPYRVKITGYFPLNPTASMMESMRAEIKDVFGVFGDIKQIYIPDSTTPPRRKTEPIRDRVRSDSGELKSSQQFPITITYNHQASAAMAVMFYNGKRIGKRTKPVHAEFVTHSRK